MLREQAQALLLVSVDELKWDNPLDWLGKALEAIPGAQDAVSDALREAVDANVDAAKASDILNPTLRIPIPITDGIIPIHQVGYQAHHNLGVSNQEVATTTATGVNQATGNQQQTQGFTIKNVFRPGQNQIQLQFEMKNNLRKLSTLADIITQNTKSLASRSVRVSYFSSTMCVFDSTLVGVNRAAVQNTDKEILTLTLELETGDTQRQLDALKKDTPEAKDEIQKKIAEAQSKASAQMAVAAQVNIPSMIAPTAEEWPEIRDGYLFYRVASAAELEDIPVTDFDSTQTIQLQSYRIFRVVSESVNNQRRNMLGIQYGNEIITLQNDKLSTYKGRLGLVRVLGVFYLGIKA